MGREVEVGEQAVDGSRSGPCRGRSAWSGRGGSRGCGRRSAPASFSTWRKAAASASGSARKFSSQKAANAAASPSSGHQRCAACSTPRRMRRPPRRDARDQPVDRLLHGLRPDGRPGRRSSLHDRPPVKDSMSGNSSGRRLRPPASAPRTPACRRSPAGRAAVAVERLHLLAGEGIELERLDDPPVDRLQRPGADAAALEASSAIFCTASSVISSVDAVLLEEVPGDLEAPPRPARGRCAPGCWRSGPRG